MLGNTENYRITLFLVVSVFIIKYGTLQYARAVPGGIPGVCNSVARITKLTDLSFGAMLVDYTGSLVIDTNDGVSTTGGVTRFSGAISTSRFQVTGCPDKAYTIILPDIVTISSTTSSMNVDSFISNPVTGLLDPNGKQDISVGARLNVITSQAPGDYSGSFPVEVAFE